LSKAVYALIAALGLGLWLATPGELGPGPDLATVGENLEAWALSSDQYEADTFGLIPGAERQFTWAVDGAQTPFGVIAIHGFSASRQETAPLASHVANALQANLYEVRLTGHGRASDPLVDVRAEDWQRDLTESLQAGARIGERLVLLTTSTGSTLVTAMLDHALMSRVDTIVMISPNFRPKNENSAWLTRFGGRISSLIALGRERCWNARNELQARFWSTCYPTSALIEVMRLVNRAKKMLPRPISQRLLVFYSGEDQVVSPVEIRKAFELLDAPEKKLIEVQGSGDPSQHVLAGEIMSPQTTDEIATTIVDFIGHPTP
jgi:esterase/lipase